MAVGKLRRMVVDVNDLATGEAFWSAVTGLEVRFSAWQGQFSGLGEKETGSILLQLVPERKTELKNRAHIDLTVDDVSRAVEEVIALGGSVIRTPRSGAIPVPRTRGRASPRQPRCRTLGPRPRGPARSR
jgi:predicted enzyme related to lactoylglutathione lyase